ncbi:MAG: DegT/DnrJ/EryC1/StrS family aminotransferase [Phycisphaerales bacterium]
MTDAIPLSRPDICDAEIRAVVETLKSGRLSLGPNTPKFEQGIAQRGGRSQGVAVCSGTAGLHLALLALGVGPGDEVITPAFSFVASANCVLHVGATPVFADCDAGSLNVTPQAIERKITPRTKAIIAVEVFGNPAGFPDIERLAAKHEIPLIEDCCEGLGSKIDTRPAGSFGRVGVFSFYPNKQMTTAEGGVIVTDDNHLADMCRSLRNQGRASGGGDTGPGLGSWLQHERLGYNFRLSELHAALGNAQLNRLDNILERRAQVAASYTERLAGNTNLILPTVEPGVEMSWFVYVVRLTNQFSRFERDEIIAGLRRHEIGASDYFPPIPLMPFYQDMRKYKPGDFPVAESVSQRTIALPFFNSLTEHEIDLVCQTLDVMIQRVSFSRG